MALSANSSAGWLGVEIQSAVTEIETKAYIPQSVKDRFTRARETILDGRSSPQRDPAPVSPERGSQPRRHPT